jgi:hypothetical protein
MPERNRVTPYGEIVASTLRGAWMGNRGSIHRGNDIVRQWNTRRWITCALSFKYWVAPKWVPGRWTALFFFDEALSFAAGHRPCALCRRVDYDRYRAAVGIDLADAIDLDLHGERLDGRVKRTHVMAWRDVPAGTYVEIEGTPHVVLLDRVRPWLAASGYGDSQARPRRGDARILTPPTSVGAFVAGYQPQIGP